MAFWASCRLYLTQNILFPVPAQYPEAGSAPLTIILVINMQVIHACPVGITTLAALGVICVLQYLPHHPVEKQGVTGVNHES